MKFSLNISLYFLSALFSTVCGQIKPQSIDFEMDSISLEQSEIILKKEYHGKVETEIDSSLYYKFESDNLEFKKFSLESKALKNIGFGKIITPINSTNNFQLPKPKTFEGFEMVDNANYALSNITIEEGLPNNNVTKTFQDSQGSIWIGYSNGEVSRLQSNQIYSFSNSELLTTDYVTDIIEVNGAIWISTFGGGISILENNKITRLNKKNAFPSDHINSMCQDNNGNLWIATYGSGLIRYKESVFYHYNSIHESVEPIIHKVVADTMNNNIWLFDNSNNIFKIDNSYNTSIINIVNQPITYDITDISFNSQLYVLLNDNRIAKIGPKIFELAKIKSNSTLTTVKALSENKAWLGDADGQVYIVNGKNINHIKNINGMGNSQVAGLFIDDDRNFWISTLGNGIYRSFQSSFINLINEKDDFYINKNVFCTYNDNLVFTSKSSVSLLNPNNILVHYNHKLFKDILGITSNGSEIWLASFYGILEIKGDSVFSYKNPLASQSGYNSNTNIQYKNGKLIANNYNYGWYERCLDSDKWFRYKNLPDITFTTSTFIDSKNRNWIASSKSGICFHDSSTLYIVKKDIGTVTNYCEDANGDVWIATSNGLFKWGINDKLFKFNIGNEVANSLTSITYSNYLNSIWIGTNSGLLLLNIEDLTLNIYNKQSGINGSSFKRGAGVSLNGSTYWITNKAIVQNFPYVLNVGSNNPTISLSEIKFNFEKVDFENLKKANVVAFDEIINSIPTNLSFEKNDNSINFIFTSNQWGKESNLNYFYRLNKNDGWIGPVLDGQITLQNLPLGIQSMEVKAITFNQTESNIITYEFEITQPFYKDLWFITLMIGLIILLGLIVFTIRSNFDFNNFKSYSTYTVYLHRLRFLAFGLTFAFPVIEWVTAEVLQIVSPNWYVISLVVVLGTAFIFTTYVRKVSETSIAIFALVNSLVFTVFILFRLSVENYAPLLTVEFLIVVAFSTIVFDNMRLFLIYWIIIVSIVFYSGMTIGYQTNNEVIYVLGSLLILFFSFSFHIFQVNKIGKIVFADKILNTYDKLVLVYNKDGEVVYANPYLNNFFEEEDNHILGLEWYSLRNCSKDETVRIRKDITSQITTNNATKIIDERIYSPFLKSERLIEWSFQIIEEQFLMAIGSDVTKAREQENRISLLSKVSETVSNGVVIRDKNDKIIWCNESFEKLIDYQLEDLIGNRPSKFFRFPTFYQSELNFFDENLGQNLVSIEIPILKENDEIVWLLMNDTVVYNEQGDIEQFISIVSDITENKQREEEIKELSTVAQSVTNGVLITSPEGLVKWSNQSFTKISGYCPEEILGNKPSKLLKTPDFFQSELDDYVENGPFFNKSKQVAHFNKNGEVIWLLINSTPIYSDDNKLIQIIEIVTDITDQKNQEKDYARLSLVAEHSQNPIIIMNDVMQIDWVNGAFVKEFGYSENEVIGQVPGKLLKGEKSDLTKFTNLEKVLLRGRKGSSEFQLYDKFGKSIWIQASVDPVYDSKGKIYQYICLMQNIQIVKEAQKIIEIKNKDITDSINYAKRIQSSILPNLKLVKKNLPEHFMFYKPKDVVSGDFYFMEFIDNKVIVAVADCTGHGVPGAMMTSIGSAGLNNAILDKRLSDPSAILEHLDNYIKNSLSASSEGLTDGMDIGVLAFNLKTQKVEYCGAKRPLVIVRESGELSIIPGIKRSIGEFTFGVNINFVTSEIHFNEEAFNIYCFSDGLPDQFGGPDNKKLYLKKLNHFLAKNRKLPLAEQHEALKAMLIEWTSNYTTPQTDDMVLFGAKVTSKYFKQMQKLID